MSGADRNAVISKKEQRDRARTFCTESTYRAKLGDFRSHRVHNSPAAEVGPHGDGRIRAENNEPLVLPPAGSELGRRKKTARQQCAGDDAHGLLRVITAMAQAIG